MAATSQSSDAIAPAPLAPRRPEATVRALVVHDSRLLLVSNDGGFWYTPGGRIEHGEDAQIALVRELAEEVGLEARVAGFCHVEQFFKPSRDLHHINLYFWMDLTNPAQALRLEDPDRQVSMARFFSVEDLQGLEVNPRSLKDGWWRARTVRPSAWAPTDRA
ncbi:MAG TPA: NUDIX domain-containing protein [Alphaproteobacteria bacterium]|nr:NUDIX domain-containing protein [Alphaproteobacteria bacterium]